MKKYFYSVLAASMLFACSQEEIVDVNQSESQQVTFKVELPATATSRTVGGVVIGSGSQADSLIYAMYEHDNDTALVQGVVADMDDNVNDGTFKVTVPMAKEITYDLLFLAYNSSVNSAFAIAQDAKKTNLKALAFKAEQTPNVDAYDAFVGSLSDQGINAAATTLVELRRPFAQVNAATALQDLKDAETLGAKVVKSNLVIENVPTTYNVLSGVTSGSQTVNFRANEILSADALTNGYKNETIEVDGTTYYYLTLAYVLAGKDPSTHEATFNFFRDGDEVVSELNILNLPVQRNYRTNVVGSLVTKNKDFEVKIDADFAGENGVNDNQVYAKVTSTEEFNAAFENDFDVIVLDRDINLNDLGTRAAEAADPSLTIKKGKTLTIDLNGKTLSATSSQTGKNYNMFDVNGGTLTVKNGTMVYEHKGENMGWNSSTNLFNVTAGGVLNLEGVTAHNLGGSDMGFVAHLNNWGEVTLNVTDCTLESNYVAVRVFNSGYDMNNVTIKNSTLKGGSYAFWVHNYTTADFGTAEKADAQKALLNFDIFNGTNTFIGKNDTPIRYGMTNAEYHINNKLAVKTAEELAELVNNATSEIAVEFANDLEGKISLIQKKDIHVTILGNGKHYTGGIHIFGNGASDDRSMTIKGIKFDGTGLTDDEGCIYTTGNVNGLNSYACNVTIEDCTFTGAGVAAIRQNVAGERDWTINNCTVTSDMHSFLQVSNTNGELIVENCKVYSKNGANLNSTCVATFTGCEFDVQGYAVRVGVNSGGNPEATKLYTFTNSTLKSQNLDGDAVVIIRKDAQKATLNFVETELIGDPMISGNTADTKITGVAMPQQANEIWYTATALVHAHWYTDKFGAGTDLVSNVWDEATGKGVITLSGPVTIIGTNAFYEREHLTSITFPNGVAEIGEDAFDHCPNLTSVEFGNNLQIIGEGAFSACDKLANVTIPESVTTIGASAFNSCTALKSITIPAGVTSIGDFAFNGIKDIKVYCKPTTPPTVGLTPFNKWWAEIYVPAASLTAYQEAWGSVADNIYAE